MRVTGSLGGAFIEWQDGVLTVTPDMAREEVERRLSKPVTSWRSVEPEQGRIEEQIVSIPPGTAEHVALALLAAPDGILIDGDDAIPAEDDDADDADAV